MEDNIYSPLVSVWILGYNDSAYIVDALNSINAQTYKNIELIISDDCSTDNTIEICEEWLKSNRNRFTRTILLKSKTNTGVTCSCNRALKASTGVWLKVLASDDILVSDAIEKYVNFVIANKHVKALFGNCRDFYGDFNYNKLSPASKMLKNSFFGPHVTANKQYNILTKVFQGKGSTIFLNRDVVNLLGGYDENFPITEDHPFFIKLTKNGYKLYYFDEVTVYKRCHQESLQHKMNNNALIPNIVIQLSCKYKWAFRYNGMSLSWKFLLSYTMLVERIIIKYGNNSKSKFWSLFYYFYNLLFNPFVWYSRLLNIQDHLLDIKRVKSNSLTL